MRVLVCGGRNYGNVTRVAQELAALHGEIPHDCMLVIQGGATGADRIARVWCEHNFVQYANYAADWNAHGKAAGPMRNQRMLDHGKPDIVLAFPGGRGTADMVRRAKAAGVPVREIND